MTYELEIDDGGEVARSFSGYVQRHPRRAARALSRLAQFSQDGLVSGEFLRGNGNLSIYILEPSYSLSGAQAPMLLVLVDSDAKTMELVRIEYPPLLPSREDLVEWAEALLKI